MVSAGVGLAVMGVLFQLASGETSAPPGSPQRGAATDPALANALRQALGPLANSRAPVLASLSSAARIEHSAQRLARLDRVAAGRIPRTLQQPRERGVIGALRAALLSQAVALTRVARSARSGRRPAYVSAATAVGRDARRLFVAILALDKVIGFTALPLPSTVSLPSSLPLSPSSASTAPVRAASTPAASPLRITPQSYAPAPSHSSGSGEPESQKIPPARTEKAEPIETPKPAR